MSIPAYLILGSPACGRRGIACDIVEKALGDDDFCCVFVADDENPSDFDKRIAGAPNAGIVKYSGFADATAKIAALDESKITSIIFVAASSENVADSVENFKAIVGDGKIRPAVYFQLSDVRKHILRLCRAALSRFRLGKHFGADVKAGHVVARILKITGEITAAATDVEPSSAGRRARLFQPLMQILRPFFIVAVLIEIFEPAGKPRISGAHFSSPLSVFSVFSLPCFFFLSFLPFLSSGSVSSSLFSNCAL